MISIRHILGLVLPLMEGLVQIVQKDRDLGEVEKDLHRLVQAVSAELLRMVLEDMDEQLLKTRKKGLKPVGMRSRRILTALGEVSYKRRLYRGPQGESHFLLDESLGLEKGQQMSPRLKEMAVEMATDLPFRRAAKHLEYLAPGISAMSVWHALQAVGQKAQARTKALRQRVSERGKMPEGETVESLRIEADGVMVNLQRGPTRRGEIKLVVGYEDKDEVRGGQNKRLALRNRQVVAGLVGEEQIWDEAGAKFAQKWALEQAQQVWIGGDGASWVKKGAEEFAHAQYQLDKFHLRKRMLETLGYSEDTLKAAREAIKTGSWDKVEAVLEEAAKKARSKQRKQVEGLKKYLGENWEGIRQEGISLGVIEGQVYHHLARRMKRLGARWSPQGADRMARVQAARANGELKEIARERWGLSEAKQGPALSVGIAKAEKRTDLEEWLRAHLPALNGPQELWTRQTLRELSGYGFSVA